MSTLRAVRRLRFDPIPDEAVERVFTAVTWAPTSGNNQGWHIVAVRDAWARQNLKDLYQPLRDVYEGY